MPYFGSQDGHFDIQTFHRCFRESLLQHNIDIKPFLLTTPLPPPTLDSPLSPLFVAQLDPQELGILEDDSVPFSEEGLSDIEEEDEQETTTAASSPARPMPPARRLKLVFDLDNTLLHALSKHKLLGADLVMDDFKDPQNRPDLFRFTLPRQRNQFYYVKLRPNVRDFVCRMAKHFDLAVHTNATKEYADVVMSILDPDRTLFGNRLAARDDENGQNDRKDISRLFPEDRETLLEQLLILDDRRDVWDAQFEKNIIQCNYYEFFESRRDFLTRKYGARYQNAEQDDDLVLDPYSPPGDAVTTDSLSSDDLDRQLPFLGDMMEKCAIEFYQTGRSIAAIVQEARSKVLEGCVCLMTGYNRLEQISHQYGMLDNGPQHRRRLESLGATVVEQPSESVTHVLVMRQTVSTDKARSLCSKSTQFVHNLWIYACEQTWTKAQESYFDASTLLAKYQKPPPRPLFEHWQFTALLFESLKRPPPPLEDEPLFKKRCPLPNGVIEPHSGLCQRQWLSSGTFSDGAEVWSCAEHVTLRYDNFITTQLYTKTC